MSRIYTKKLFEELSSKKEKEEWLFAIAVVKAGLQREGNFNEAAGQELADALIAFNIRPGELEEYLQKNRERLLRFLQSTHF